MMFKIAYYYTTHTIFYNMQYVHHVIFLYASDEMSSTTRAPHKNAASHNVVHLV